MATVDREPIELNGHNPCISPVSTIQVPAEDASQVWAFASQVGIDMQKFIERQII